MFMFSSFSKRFEGNIVIRDGVCGQSPFAKKDLCPL